MCRLAKLCKRFPPPWRLAEVPGGYRVIDRDGTALAYVYAVEASVRSALPGSLTPAEAHAIAKAIARLPELMPGPEGFGHGGPSMP